MWNRIRLLALMVGLALKIQPAPVPAQSHDEVFLKQGALVKFDEKNYLTFTDVGRVEGRNSIEFGTELRFTCISNESAVEIGPFPTVMSEISSQVYNIAYDGPMQFWVFCRAGRLSDGAFKISIPERRITSNYKGSPVVPSPDGKHVAYVKRNPSGDLVFIDDILIAPTVKSGFVKLSGGSPVTSDGLTPSQSLPGGLGKHRVVGGPQWQGNTLHVLCGTGVSGATQPSKVEHFAAICSRVNNQLKTDVVKRVHDGQVTSGANGREVLDRIIQNDVSEPGQYQTVGTASSESLN